MRYLVIFLVIIGGIYYQYSHTIISLVNNSGNQNKISQQNITNNINNFQEAENIAMQGNNNQTTNEILNQYYQNKQNTGKISQNTIEQSYIDSVLPVENYKISSYFGPRLQASKNYSYDFHRGIDFHHAENVDIFAIADGEIYKTYLESDPNNPYKNSGTTVIIKHTLDKPYEFHGEKTEIIYSYYTHLSEINNDFFEKYGKKINKGEKIGKMGSSGTTNYQHLHFEIRVATTCSREYQLANKDSKCSQILPNNADPHINPFVFLPQEIQNNTYTISKKQNKNSLSLTISTQRNLYGINTIIIQENGKEKIIDFNLRKSIDDINRDNNYFQGVQIIPEKFSTRSENYEISFLIDGFSPEAEIYIFDTFGKNIRN